MWLYIRTSNSNVLLPIYMDPVTREYFSKRFALSIRALAALLRITRAVSVRLHSTIRFVPDV
jgi:hypothetical protein